MECCSMCLVALWFLQRAWGIGVSQPPSTRSQSHHGIFFWEPSATSSWSIRRTCSQDFPSAIDNPLFVDEFSIAYATFFWCPQCFSVGYIICNQNSPPRSSGGSFFSSRLWCTEASRLDHWSAMKYRIHGSEFSFNQFWDDFLSVPKLLGTNKAYLWMEHVPIFLWSPQWTWITVMTIRKLTWNPKRIGFNDCVLI